MITRNFSKGKKESHIRQNEGEVKEFIALIEATRKTLDKPWDQLDINAHGVWDPKTRMPTGSISIGKEELGDGDTAEVITAKVNTAAKGIDFIFVSCFNNPGRHLESYAVDRNFGIAAHTDDPDPSKCYVNFDTLHLRREIKRSPGAPGVAATQPSGPGR
jgi:hypothetical protein